MDEIKQEPTPTENTTNTNNLNNQTINQITGSIVIAGLLIAGAILLKGNQSGNVKNTDSNDPETIELAIRPVSDTDHILGNKESKIVIVEYSDTECPFCKTFHNTMHTIIKERSGDVAWVFRHFPIPSLHSKAPHEAAATECAFEQGGNEAFWKYLDRVFAVTPSNNGLEEKELLNIADYVGLNSSSFYTCLKSDKYADKVQADVVDGGKASINGTPSSVIISQKEITPAIQKQIIKAIGSATAVSFGSPQKNMMRLNGSLPIKMVNQILDILLK